MTAQLKRRDKPTASLDSRIAQFLGNGVAEADSAAIVALITEAEAAIVKAKEAAEKEAERAFDPLNTDAEKSRTKAEQIRFTHERLVRAIPLLEAALRRAKAREHAARWNMEYEEIETRRDELAAELTALYPSLVRQLVDLFARISECDKAVGRLNLTASDGERRRLLGVELVARGLESYSSEQPPLSDRLRLPHPGLSSSLAFPPDQGSNAALALLMASSAFALATKQSAAYGPNWHAERERSLTQEQREADKHQAVIEQQEREAKAQFERDLVEADRARRTGRRRRQEA